MIIVSCHPDESRDPDIQQAPSADFWVPTFVGMTDERGYES